MKRQAGFTLIDLMLTIAIIGLLAALAMPNFIVSRQNARRNIFIAQLNKLVGGIETYAIIEGGYPPETAPGELPPGLGEYFTKSSIWTESTPIGGYWDWDYNQHNFGTHAGVSVYQPALSDEKMMEIDGKIDDGNLYTGFFQKREGGFMSIIE
jgi:prepilin-type N-terminal cleavage/methylation domain-containing protein